MPKETNWKFKLDEYIRQGEPQKTAKSEAWQIAIGLQQVDGDLPLPSGYRKRAH